MYKILRKRFNFTHETCDLKPPFLVFCNHTMDYDPFFVASSFSDPVYFVMSDHVSSLKSGKLIKHLVSPIPITKSSVDAETVKNVFSILRQNGIVGIFPEGNKSFSGDMSRIKHSTAKLVKKAKVPVVLYNITGGYLSSPRWSKIKRKGHIHCFVKDILYPEDYCQLSDDELYQKICDGIRVNAYDEQKKNLVEFVGENKAENIEALLYFCPKCKSFESVYGEGDHIKCNNCDLDAIYNNYGFIENAPFDQLDKWDAWQKEQLTKIDYESLDENHIITRDDGWEIQLKETKFKSKTLGNFATELTNKFIVFKNDTQAIKIPVNDIVGTAIEGTCSVQLSVRDGRVYRLKKELNTNGLKYVNLISRLNKSEYKF